ncbi:hypothetical protein PV327_003959 [Microctonus hyperodae]|uniref:Transport and Golgi organization protein 1 n=1 Tax=Microctonus hyperodae TaxID=165561 RepID=A0AA39G525_MICHY|nr:hypothetical protein PV327_003959 [Microctonus hyperodae]
MWNNVDSCYNKNMTGRNSFTGQYFFIIVATILSLISSCTSIISDKRLCYDPNCSDVIASAKTVSKYYSNDPHILSFNVNDDVEIFSKSAGSRPDLWGVQIAGKRGYAPMALLKEKTVYHKNLEYVVPTLEYNQQVPETHPDIHKNDEIAVGKSAIIDNVIKTEEIKPTADSTIENSLHAIADQVSPSFEVIDGTTFNLPPKDELKPDHSYATEILQNNTVMEQPILTVHPNLMSNEVIPNKDTSAETTVLSSAVNDQPSMQSMVPQTTNEELPAESSDFENASQPTTNDNVTLPIAIESTTTKTVQPLVTGENVEAPHEDNKKNQQMFQSEKIEVNNPESNDLNVDISSGNSAAQVDNIMNENPSSVLPKENIDEKTHQIIQPNELSVPVDEKSEHIIIDTISASIIDPTTDILTKAIDTVSSLFDDLPLTTEVPTDYGTDESVQEQITESTRIEENTNLNNEEILLNNTLNNTDINDIVHVDTAMENAIGSVDNTSNELNNSIDNAPDNILNVDVNISTNDGQLGVLEGNELQGSSPDIAINENSNFNEFPANRNLLNVKDDSFEENVPIAATEATEVPIAEDSVTTLPQENSIPTDTLTTSSSIPETSTDYIDYQSVQNELEDVNEEEEEEQEVIPSSACHIDDTCNNYDDSEKLPEEIEKSEESLFDNDDTVVMNRIENSQYYWETLSYVAITAVTTLLFSLGYYYMENTRRDGQLIAKINKLEKELLISSKECTVLDESLKSTKYKLDSIEDQSFGSNEMVVSLKTDLELACKAKSELEDQVVALEKDLESATEAGLELERMLREILASNNAENPLAKSIEDLQARLNSQQSANESLTKTLHLKTQENEALSSELSVTLHKCEQLEVEVTRINDELKIANETKNNTEQTLLKKNQQLENQIKNISSERITLRTQLKGKEMEIKDLLDVVKQSNVDNIDFEKLSNLSQVKAEANQLLEEKEELQTKLGELEGAHNLLEEHMKIINQEMKSLRKQCEIAGKEKQDAETRLQVLSKFFKEKEEERQKEEATWLQKQGEVATTSERLQTLNNEILSYKQQIEILKREILDQEREYKNQITNLESKSHEQWVLARQTERRLEEAKAEAGQLRNRLTLMEKNYSDNEPDVKTHRMDTNGETATSPQLFIGAEASSSPIMFTGSSNMPTPYLYGPPLPPFLPPPLHSSSMPVGYDVGQRPPPLGGRLSSPPPIPVAQTIPPPPPPSALHSSSSSRYEHSGSGPPSPPLSPSMLPPPYGHFRSHPPRPLPFHNDRIHPPPPVPLPSMLPAHLSNASWGDEKISSRNNGSFHPFHRDHQARDYKGSLVSSEESLDKTHHSGKV